MPRKDLPNLVGTHYRVYSRDGQFVRVEAVNALEAINKSNVQDILRIERDTIYLNRIVDMSKMVDSVAKKVVMAPEEPAVKAAEPVAQAVEEKAVDAAEAVEALSNNEVEKLIAADSVAATPEAGAAEATAS